MNSMLPLIEWLRAWHRGYKFAVLLIAAWAPVLFPENPIVAGVIMAVTTTLFFVVTGPSAAIRVTDSILPRGTHDAEP
jgi:hypothetical protein